MWDYKNFLEKMSILQCQELAKKIGYDSATFDLCGPNGRLHCNWRDAYMGIFQIKNDQKTYIMVSQIQLLMPVIWCENLMSKSLEK